MLLRDLLIALPGARVAGSSDVVISDVAYDSRKTQPGSLFVAVPSVGGDTRSGGYAFIAEAVRRSAAAIVSQAPISKVGVPVAVVPDARVALAEIAAEFFGHPSRQLQVFAVTGTDGKTTTSYLLEQIFRHAGFTTGLMGTVEIKIGDRRTFNADRMTTPESLDLQRLLRAMVDDGVTHVALEASSHALALDRLRGTTLTACAVTNITADHIEFHGSQDAYFRAKASLFTELGRGRPAILNADDASFEPLSRLAGGPIVAYALDGPARLQAHNLRPSRWSTHFTLAVDGTTSDVTLPLPGRFNVSNALAAAGLALSAGLPPETLADGLSAAEPPPGRLQRVITEGEVDVLVDYAHTPNAFRSVLSDIRLRTGPGRRIIAVFGAAGGRDRSKRPLLARVAREYADYFIVTNEDPCDESPDAIISEVAAGVPSSEEGTCFERESDRGRAIEKAIGRARRGDVVIILGKGHERSIVVNGRKESWNDVTAARAILESER
jgi:UDP-N-acetylmuramoyl-L-alanyl-D-glutamate--2,6-diaminopimelate ligase